MNYLLTFKFATVGIAIKRYFISNRRSSYWDIGIYTTTENGIAWIFISIKSPEITPAIVGGNDELGGCISATRRGSQLYYFCKPIWINRVFIHQYNIW